MMDPEREMLLRKLAELCELAPEFRFGQMICNLAFAAKGNSPSAPWDVEDQELLVALEEYIANWQQIQKNVLVNTK